MTKPQCLKAICLILVLFLCIPLFGCSKLPNDTTVSWFDADGTIIETAEVNSAYNPITRELPADTDMWHYTDWSVSKSGNIIVCTANRARKTTIIWKDFDGTTIAESFMIDGQVVPERELPESDVRWTYTKWLKEDAEYKITYTANKAPNTSYFCGNVFQIVIKDQAGEPLGVGSGFVINDEGWFITNNHVMENGHTACAFFDIEDSDSGTKHTMLDIIGGVYNDKKKDIFIGKIANYQKIRSHYQEITFTEEYEKDDICYSVGYPNSAITLEINEGTVLEEYSNIVDKINGVYYLLSSCYIAPGSSGGILMNQDFEVIGITSMGLYADEKREELISGGSVPTFAFKEQIKRLDETQLKSLADIYGIEINK